MRKRSRPDWPIRVLRYRAYPKQVPQAVWDIAKAQRSLWNQLVVLANRHSEWSRWLGDKKAGWAGFDVTARALVKTSNLDWVNGPDVFDRIRTSINNSKKTGGWPHVHHVLNRISISHRFTSGGMALSNAIVDPTGKQPIKASSTVDNTSTLQPPQRRSSKAKRFALQSSEHWQFPKRAHSPEGRHWRGRFQVGDNDTIDFALALHRPLSTEAILKRVQWIGERSGLKWFWYLALTIEEPPVAQVAHSSQLSAGLDLGWRVFADGTPNDYVRVGMLSDSEGRMIELRLPLALKPGPHREHRSIHYLNYLQSLVDDFINAAGELAGDKRLGRRKLLDLAPQHTNRDGILAAVAASDLMALRKREQRFSMLKRRLWWYQNLAQWLTQQYGCIVLEADMKLPELHKRSENPALRNAAQYRNYAAVGELRESLRRAASKWGSKISGEAKGTTITCWFCGAKAESGAQLELTCENGHKWDQDKNAARNLRSQIDGTFGRTHVSGKSHGTGTWKKLEIPERIQAVTVEVPPG